MDDLLDLNWAEPSSGSKPQSGSQVKPSQASFDFLSKPAAKSGANYYSTPPLSASTPSLHANTAPPATQLPGRLKPTAQTSKSGSSTPSTNATSPPTDAFSSLLSTNGSASGSMAGLTMAQRQAQLAKAKQEKADHEKAQFEANSSFWDNIGSSSKPSPQITPTEPFGDILRPTVSSTSSSRPPSAPPKVEVKRPAFDDDDLLGGGDAPAISVPQSSASSSSRQSPLPPNDPFDFDALPPSNHLAVNGSKKGSSGMRTPISDFDFGEDKEEDSEEDILGDLGRPAAAESRRESPPPPPVSRQPRASTHRSSSPPPHIVGQIVEMGFTPAQARQALAKTSSGVDVEAAIESLLGQNGESSRPRREDEFSDARRREEEEEREKERRRRRRAGPSRDSVKPRTKEEIRTGAATPELGEQADKILAQASEIGQSMYTRGLSLWSSAKERAKKAYEEQARAMDSERNRPPVKDGRPRWMVENDEDGPKSPTSPNGKVGEGFKDSDDDEDVMPERPIREVGPTSKARSTRQPQPRAQQQSETRHARDAILFDNSDDESPAPPRPSEVRKPQPKAGPPRAAKVEVPLIKRDIIDAEPHQLSTSSSHKAKGNEHFKLGRFSEAEAAYSHAISSLPDKHLHTIPLYNNRSATRLKLGDSKGAMADSTSVIEIIGLAYHPAKEEVLPSHIANEVKLADGLVKAMIKRAQAAEMAEKWSTAIEDWDRIMALDDVILGNTSAATRKLAMEGSRRSRKMIDGKASNGPAATQPASHPPQSIARSTTPSRSADVAKSQAVAELRKVAAANEAEDAQRLALKDKVDAKIAAWKGGKETNLRALIASLDSVLWDDILAGGLKVGMHELIQDKQVKIKYMKVIARLHPDKLSTSNTTVEQKMLANAVFGTLNEAWQAFSK